jgi:phosphonate transport system substrate-binding protein
MTSVSARRVACAITFALCAGQQTARADPPLEFGVFPYVPVTRIHEIYGPIARSFEASLGRRVRLSSKARYEAFGEELHNEFYDIAFIQPFDYVDAHDRLGYLPLARRPGSLEALIVVREDSAPKTLEDLKGLIVANPPADAAVSYLTSMALWGAGIHPENGVKRDYGRNHFTCLQSVALGAADACGVAEQPFRALEQQTSGGARLRVLHTTIGIPQPPFVVHRRLPAKDRNVLLRTILAWPKTQEGREILERGQFVPFVAANDAEYEVIRAYMRSRK